MRRGGERGTANDAPTPPPEGLWGDRRKDHRRRQTSPGGSSTLAGHCSRTRGALNDSQLDVLDRLRVERSVLCRCWQLKEGLRDLYRPRRPQDAPLHSDWWLAWACRCRIPAFVTLSKTVRANRDRILAAIEAGLSNSKLEGLNSKIRHQPPRLRPPFRGGSHLDDLPPLRRDHRPATHRKVRRTGFPTAFPQGTCFCPSHSL